MEIAKMKTYQCDERIMHYKLCIIYCNCPKVLLFSNCRNTWESLPTMGNFPQSSLCQRGKPCCHLEDYKFSLVFWIFQLKAFNFQSLLIDVRLHGMSTLEPNGLGVIEVTLFTISSKSPWTLFIDQVVDLVRLCNWQFSGGHGKRKMGAAVFIEIREIVGVLIKEEQQSVTTSPWHQLRDFLFGSDCTLLDI